jgi:putative membrane protein
MFVTYRGSIVRLMWWQWRSTLLFTVAAAVVALAHATGYTLVKLPTVPLAVVGGAIGIFLSFRTNSAYQRWWEGRILWGRLVNTSRHFATQVRAYLDGDDGVMRRLIYRQVAYVHVLRVVLRQQDVSADERAMRFLSDDEKALMKGATNLNHTLLQRHLDDCVALSKAGAIDAWKLQSLDESVRHLLDIQGGCERIKKTPFPRGYGFIAERLIQLYSLLFPLGLVDELGWFTIPISLIVCMAFTLISEVGRVLEDPFTMFWPALPLTALSHTIEGNLRQRLGDTDLPPPVVEDARGVLM